MMSTVKQNTNHGYIFTCSPLDKLTQGLFVKLMLVGQEQARTIQPRYLFLSTGSFTPPGS